MPAQERPIYSIGAVERMVDVPAATIRNWEQRYGLVTPERSSGGHRLYTRGQVERLRFVSRSVANGVRPAEAHRLLEERIAAQEPLSPLDEVDEPPVLILIADRDRYAAELAEFFLRTEGHDVTVSADAGEAERTLDRRLADVAIVEMMISGGTGAELCRRLKERGVPACLAVSSLAAREDALAAGADAFLAKPLDPLELVSTIKDLLGSSALLHQTTRKSG